MEHIISSVIIPCSTVATLFSTIDFANASQATDFRTTLIHHVRTPLMMFLCTGRTLMSVVLIFRRYWLHRTKMSTTSVRTVCNFWALLCKSNPQGSPQHYIHFYIWLPGTLNLCHIAPSPSRVWLPGTNCTSGMSENHFGFGWFRPQRHQIEVHRCGKSSVNFSSCDESVVCCCVPHFVHPTEHLHREKNPNSSWEQLTAN